MRAKAAAPEHRLHVIIRKGRKTEKVETYRYFSIVDILRTFGASRQDAYDAAKWAMRATEGLTRTIHPEIAPEITMEIRYENHTGTG